MSGCGREPPSISVVIPTRDRPHGLERLLGSIDRLSGTLPLEVIVVDDGSRISRTQDVIKSWLQDVHPYRARLIAEPMSRGPGHARNRGAEAARHEILAFIDDDCVAAPSWLSMMVNCLDPYEQVAGVGGKVLPLRNDLVSQYYDFHRILDPPPSLLYLVSANCCYRRSALLSVGGYEEELPWPGGEDIGLSFRLTHAGWKFGFAPEAIVYHEYRSNPLDFIRTFRNYGRGSRVVTEKAFGPRERTT